MIIGNQTIKSKVYRLITGACGNQAVTSRKSILLKNKAEVK
jgi:hypothetical protein